jgi:outer membrane immunogenic protein
MRNSLSGWLIVRALAVVLGVAVPILTSGQEKNDRSTAPNAAERSDALFSPSESGSVAAATGSAKPNSPAPSATSYTWKGGYVGGHIGWGSGRANTTFTPLPTATQFIDMAPTSLRPNPNGFSGGAQGGYNWQTGHFVVGGEADISWSRMSGTATVTPINRNNGTPFPGSGFLTTHQDTKWFGTVRPRAGVAFGRVFLYGTGGLAYGHVNYSANSDFRPGGTIQYPASLSKTKAGWSVGGGAEVGISKHWSWKAEYLYYDLGNQSFTANPVPANPPFQIAYGWKTRAHTFNSGINFRF